MKGTVSKTIILGRLGQDPDIRTTAGGTKVANLNVATNELGPKNESGERMDPVTEWHRIVLFGRRAEVAEQYLKKGSQVYIEGRNRTRKWQDAQGIDRYTTEIHADEMQFIGGRSDGQQPGNQPQNSGGFGQTPNAGSGGFQQQGGFTQQPAPQQPSPGGFEDFDDDIPF